MFFKHNEKIDNNVLLGADVRRDWVIICLVFLCLGIIVIVADFFLFWGRGDFGGDFTQVDQGESLQLDRARLQSVVGEWREREGSYKKLIEEGEAVVIDPSL